MSKVPMVTRKLGVKKKEKKVAAPRSLNASKLLDSKHIGDEVTDWASVSDIGQAIYQNLRHYNYFYDNKDAFKWGLVWVKKYYGKADVDAYSACEDWHVNTTFGGMARMQIAGAPLPDKDLLWLKKKAGELMAIGRKNLEVNDKAVVPKVVTTISLQDRINDFIGGVEEVIDQYHTQAAVFDSDAYSVYTELKKIGAAKAIAKATREFYTPLYAQLEELLTVKPSDLVEAYKKHMPRAVDQKKYAAFIKHILDDCDAYMNAATVVKTRKPRAKKVTPVEKLIEKLKFQKESSEFKVTSMNPTNIIGASELYLFNTKYRTLTRIQAETETGLSIRGTTIINTKEPIMKKALRKPTDTLPQLQATRARVGKVFEDLKTKEGIGNGRVNEDTIILKVFK